LGTLCGLLNGLLIIRMRLSPFIITLATASIFLGINLGFTSGQPFYRLPDGFRNLGVWTVAGVPGLLIVTVVYSIVLAFFFSSTGIGRQILAMGGNTRAAELIGVPTARCQIVVHGLSGFLAASAAVMLTARIGAAQPSVGDDWLLASFAAPIIGGTSLAGGYLSVPGALVGALVLTLVSNGLVHLRIDVFWTALFSGLIILAAGGVDRVRGLNAHRMEREQRRQALATRVPHIERGVSSTS
jgi:ribose transport system permease protein